MGRVIVPGYVASRGALFHEKINNGRVNPATSGKDPGYPRPVDVVVSCEGPADEGFAAINRPEGTNRTVGLGADRSAVMRPV
jgi:hypothetical protein